MNETLNIQNGVSPITIDTKVTEGSTRPVMGGGIYEAIAGMAEPFVVEFTPTSLDLTTGTMSKTVGEITAAWQAGQKVMFRISVPGQGGREMFCSEAAYDASHSYPSYNAVVVVNYGGTPRLAWLYTGITDNPDKNTWVAYYYELTPVE